MGALDLVITEFVFMALVCVVLMRYYSGPMVTFDVIFTVYLSWVLGLVGILLLPYDISQILVDSNYGATLGDVWRFVYWRYLLFI